MRSLPGRSFWLLLGVSAFLVACASGGGAAGGAGDSGAAATFTLTTYTMASPGAPSRWIAAADGDGPFVALQGLGGLFRFTPRAARFAVAVACPGDGQSRPTLYVQHLARGERRTSTRVCGSAGLGAQPALSVSVSGQPSDRSALGVVFDAMRWQPPGVIPSLAWNVAPGTHDIALGLAANESAPLERLHLWRDVEVMAPRALTIDAANVPRLLDARNFEVAAPGAGESLSLQAQLWTARGTVVPLATGGGAVGRAATLSYPRLADDARRMSDVYVLRAEALTQAAVRYTSQASPVSLRLSTAFSGRPAVTRSPGPSLGLRVDFFAPVEGAVDYTLRVATRGARWVATFTPAWLAAGGEATAYALPSLADVPAELRLAGDANVEWAFEARSANRDAAAVWAAVESPAPTAALEGLELQLARQKGFSTP